MDQHRDQWIDVLKDIRGGEMSPPTAMNHPTLAERKIIADWVQGELYKYDPAHPDPGRVTIHRLNRAEYNNTIRDLVGVDFKPAEDFPSDDSGYGFDNMGDVLSLSPVLMEKYLAAATRVMDEAIVTQTIPSQLRHYNANLMAMGFNADVAKELSRRLFEMAIVKNPVLREYYNAELGEGLGQTQFWGFTALYYVMPLELALRYDPSDLHSAFRPIIPQELGIQFEG